MRQLQNDLEKIGSFYQNHRSNIPPDSAFTYGQINRLVQGGRATLCPSTSGAFDCTARQVIELRTALECYAEQLQRSAAELVA